MTSKFLFSSHLTVPLILSFRSPYTLLHVRCVIAVTNVNSQGRELAVAEDCSGLPLLWRLGLAAARRQVVRPAPDALV